MAGEAGKLSNNEQGFFFLLSSLPVTPRRRRPFIPRRPGGARPAHPCSGGDPGGMHAQIYKEYKTKSP